MEVIITKPIMSFFGHFIAYIFIHIVIGMYLNNTTEDFKKNPEDKKLEKNIKYANILFKWFPFIYLIFVLISLITM